MSIASQLSFSTATSLVGGATGSIPYQSANSSTVFVPIGTNGYLLQSNGTTATWVIASGITSGNATAADTVKTVGQPASASYYPTFVDANNASSTAELLYTTSSFVINPNTGNVGIGVSSTQAKLDTTTLNVGVGNGAVSGTVARFNTVNANINGLVLSNWTGSATTQGPRIAFDNSGQGTFTIGGGNGTNTFDIATTWGTPLVRVDGSGNVNIGTFTTSIAKKLTVVGEGNFSDASNNTRLYMGFGTIPATGGTGSYVFNADNSPFVFGTTNLERMRIAAGGNVLIGTVTDSGYKLEVSGSFAATTKSFVINHPTQPGMKLRYGSLEGPENGVYIRGKLAGTNTIELPEYWTKLVDPNSITVSLTPIGKHQDLYVADIANNVVTVGNGNILSKAINCFYVVYGERADVDKLVVEI